MVTFTASNGTAPYKSISITMNRPLKCNQINDAGDEVWAPGSGGSTINNGCPASPGLAILAPVSTKLNTLSYSVTVTLMDDAWIIGTVTDYNNCTKTDSIFVHGEDVRCFAADKPGNPQKVQLCHKTGSTRNPCVTICVDEDAVQEHLLHGDTYGACPKTGGCPPPSLAVNSTTSSSISITTPIQPKTFNAKIANNPSFGGSEYTLTIESGSNEDVHIIVTNIYGAKVFSANGAATQAFRFGSRFTSGTYIVQIIQGKNIKTLKIIKGEG